MISLIPREKVVKLRFTVQLRAEGLFKLHGLKKVYSSTEVVVS